MFCKSFLLVKKTPLIKQENLIKMKGQSDARLMQPLLRNGFTFFMIPPAQRHDFFVLA
jgi:hypothetical protein